MALRRPRRAAGSPSCILLLLLMLFTQAPCRSAHTPSCGHAALQRSVHARRMSGEASTDPNALHVQGRPHGHLRRDRLLQASNSSSPLRISVAYSAGVSSLPHDLQRFIQSDVIPRALRRVADMLSLATPSSTRLFAHRSCLAYGSNAPDSPYVCVSYAPITSCDLPDSGPSVALNASMLAPDDTYTLNATSGLYVRNGSLPGGDGVPDTDMHVFITAWETTACSGGSLGYAGTCQRDAWDRPTFARMNLCPAGLTSMFPSQTELAVLLVVHELMHSLGFSGSSFPLFRSRDAARTPLTPRNVDMPWLPHAQYRVASPCGGSTYVASNSTIRYFSERGMSECIAPAGVLPTSSCVAKFVTPTAIAAARAFFNCSALNGAELENQDTGCDVPGSHLAYRIHVADTMVPYVSRTRQGVTPITLAIMHDSGWYNANFSAADTFRKDIDWGYKQGCDFALQPCMVLDGEGDARGQGRPPHFMNDAREMCRIDRAGFAEARVRTYSYDLPGQYQYLGDVNVGGDETMQWCPWLQPNGRMCNDATAMRAQEPFYGSSFSNLSMCHASTLADNSFNSTSLPPAIAACYPTLCMDDGRMLIGIRSAVSQGSGMTSISCTTGGQVVTVAGYRGAITCPDVASICLPAVQDLSGRPVPVMNAVNASGLRAQNEDLTPLFGALAPSPSSTPSLSSMPTVTASCTSSVSSAPTRLGWGAGTASASAGAPPVSSGSSSIAGMPAYGIVLAASTGAALLGVAVILVHRHVHKASKARKPSFEDSGTVTSLAAVGRITPLHAVRAQNGGHSNESVVQVQSPLRGGQTLGPVTTDGQTMLQSPASNTPDLTSLLRFTAGRSASPARPGSVSSGSSSPPLSEGPDRSRSSSQESRGSANVSPRKMLTSRGVASPLRTLPPRPRASSRA